MTDINANISHLQEKLQLLIKEFKQLQKENNRLLKDIAVAKAEKEVKINQLNQLEQKVAAVQLTSGNWNDAEKAGLQKKIDTYLKEIDKCLALLHA
jgi:chromosome segregation ATPase